MGGFPQGFMIAAFIPSPTLKGAAASGTPVCPTPMLLASGSGRRKVMELMVIGDTAPETLSYITSMAPGNWKFFFIIRIFSFSLSLPSIFQSRTVFTTK